MSINKLVPPFTFVAFWILFFIQIAPLDTLCGLFLASRQTCVFKPFVSNSTKISGEMKIYIDVQFIQNVTVSLNILHLMKLIKTKLRVKIILNCTFCP